jgi:acetyltransferase-like isoleucine patch superfamily enzyme
VLLAYVAPVVIKKNAWVTVGVTILAGVTIGEGSIIEANSVVTKDIPPRCLAAGNPAKVIKELVE